MPGPFGRLFQNFDDLVTLSKDENFRKFLSNPKVQALMQDESFRQAVQEKNVFKLISNKDFTQLLQESEVRIVLEDIAKKHKKDG